jgi:AraC-like DNA-binding protein
MEWKAIASYLERRLPRAAMGGTVVCEDGAGQCRMSSPNGMDKTSDDESLSLDLSQVDALHRVTAWRDWMRSSFPEFSLAGMAAPAEGGVRAISLGDARLWRIQAPAGRIRRTPDPTSPRDAFVTVLLEGACSIAREGNVYAIEVGQVCIGRVAADGAEMSSEVPTTFLLLEVPSACLTARHPQLEHLRFHMCEQDQPGAVMLSELLLRALSVGDRLEEYQRRIALAAIVELIVLPLTGVRPRDPGVMRVDRSLAQINERLHDPCLTATGLAREQGISRRRLDELFVNVVGTPVAACIADRRLVRASQLLRDPAHLELSVSRIAAQVGFHDASHFSRVFKGRFGATPKAWRAGGGTHSTE